MKTTLPEKNQEMVNTIFIHTLICVYLFDHKTAFINGIIQGIKDLMLSL